MKDWLRRLFAVDNSVNEDTVMGSVFVVATLVEGFSRAPDPMVFWGFLAAAAAFFGKNITKGGTGG